MSQETSLASLWFAVRCLQASMATLILAVFILAADRKPTSAPPPGTVDVYFYIDSTGRKHWVEMPHGTKIDAKRWSK